MPLPHIGPNKKRGRWYEATTRFAGSRPGQFLARHVNPRIDPCLYRATAGRYPSCLGTIPTAPLTATVRRLSDKGGGCGAADPCHPARAAVAASCSRLRSPQVCNIASFYSRGRSRLLSHLASDEAFGGPGIDDAPGIDLLTLSFVAVVDAIPLDDRRVAI